MEYLTDKFLGLKINTNASRLTEEKCHAILQSNASTIVFSADAATEPLYSSMRVNGKLDQTLSNVENFQKIRSKHYPQSSIISRVSGVKFSKEQTIEDMECVWGELVDQVAFVDYNPWENSYKCKPSHVSQPCSDLWRRMFIWWDGKANPCDVDYLSKYKWETLRTSLSAIYGKVKPTKAFAITISTKIEIKSSLVGDAP